MVLTLETTEVVGRKAPALSKTTSLLAPGFICKRYLLPLPAPAPVTLMPIPVYPPPPVVASVSVICSPVVICPLPALAVIVLPMAVPEVSDAPVTWKIVWVVALESILMVPLLPWLLVTDRFGIVTVPVPNVTGRLVVVLIERVVAEVRSITGLDDEILVVTLFNVTVPVPVAKVLLPVIVVAPFSEMAPVPVPKVPVPEIKKFPEP